MKISSANAERAAEMREVLEEHRSGVTCDQCPTGAPCGTASRLQTHLDEVLAGQFQVRQVGPAPIETTINPNRPKAGSAASNQFGTFEVKRASDPQVRFIQRLLSERDLGGLAELASGLVRRASDAIAENALNKRTASDVIEILLACPERTDRPALVASPASDKQVSLIKRLIGEKDLSSTGVTWDDDLIGAMDKAAASRAIDLLFGLPRLARPEIAELADGIYRKADGRIYKVQRAVHGSGRMTAKLLVIDEQTRTGSFEYQGLASRFVTSEERMSLQEAKQFGALYGFCVRCGATLTDEKSIEAGIGPICAGRF
jgi:hypothetical protein